MGARAAFEIAIVVDYVDGCAIVLRTGQCAFAVAVLFEIADAVYPGLIEWFLGLGVVVLLLWAPTAGGLRSRDFLGLEGGSMEVLEYWVHVLRDRGNI